MPFKKVNIKNIIDEKTKENIEFREAYEQVEKEYALIRMVVKARRNVGLTQQQLADKIGVKQQVISRFEREKHIPTLDSFLKILDGVGLELKLQKKPSKYRALNTSGLKKKRIKTSVVGSSTQPTSIKK